MLADFGSEENVGFIVVYKVGIDLEKFWYYFIKPTSKLAGSLNFGVSNAGAVLGLERASFLEAVESIVTNC